MTEEQLNQARELQEKIRDTKNCIKNLETSIPSVRFDSNNVFYNNWDGFETIKTVIKALLTERLEKQEKEFKNI